MIKIEIQVNDKYILEFINKLEIMEKENNFREDEIKIFGLSISEYKKHCLEKKE